MNLFTPGKFAVRSWISEKTNMSLLKDSLTIYEGGDKQGFLWTTSTGKTNWVVFQVEYRLQQEGGILEGCTILHETSAPLHYFSIDTYPMRLEQVDSLHFLFSLPEIQILMTLSEEPLWSPMPPSQVQQPQLSLGQHQSRAGPGSHVLPKSDSSKRADGQPQSQNKNTFSPTLKALPSSNRGGRGQRLSQVPKKQGVSPQQYSLKHHNGHESSGSHPLTNQAPQPPSFLPRLEVE